MSAKKKNPLKDINAFLAHQEQASQIAVPNPVANHDEYLEQKPSQVAKVVRPEKVKITEEVTLQSAIKLLQQLMQKNPSSARESLSEVVIKTVEQLEDRSPADTMLINTLLYLNNQDDWKAAVEAYWAKR